MLEDYSEVVEIDVDAHSKQEHQNSEARGRYPRALPTLFGLFAAVVVVALRLCALIVALALGQLGLLLCGMVRIWQIPKMKVGNIHVGLSRRNEPF